MMAIPQFDLRRTPRPRKLTRNEIDVIYRAERQRGNPYMPTINGPVHINEWRKAEYEKLGLEVNSQNKRS